MNVDQYQPHPPRIGLKSPRNPQPPGECTKSKEFVNVGCLPESGGSFLCFEYHFWIDSTPTHPLPRIRGDVLTFKPFIPTPKWIKNKEETTGPLAGPVFSRLENEAELTRVRSCDTKAPVFKADESELSGVKDFATTRHRSPISDCPSTWLHKNSQKTQASCKIYSLKESLSCKTSWQFFAAVFQRVYTEMESQGSRNWWDVTLMWHSRWVGFRWIGLRWISFGFMNRSTWTCSSLNLTTKRCGFVFIWITGHVMCHRTLLMFVTSMYGSVFI